jgi:hypothetical protein
MEEVRRCSENGLVFAGRVLAVLLDVKYASRDAKKLTKNSNARST